MSYSIKKAMKEEFTRAIADNGETLESLRNDSHEWVEGYLPVYNNTIIAEWQNMPGDYDNRGHAELGRNEEIDIINLMSLDLYLYYTDLVHETLNEMEAGE
jgi:hypothetical protein